MQEARSEKIRNQQWAATQARARRLIWDTRRDWDEAQHPRDEGGKFTSGGGGGGAAKPSPTAFVSPNVGNLNFAQAVAALNSKGQQDLRKTSDFIDQKLGIQAETSSVIGAWADGAENSMMMIAPGASDAQMRAAMAMKGWLADQKSVLIFNPQEGGDAFMANFDVTGSAEDVHQKLLNDGLEFHTLQPLGADSYRVHIYGSDQSTLDAINKAASEANAEIEITAGSGEFLGTSLETGSDREQRDDARRIYDEAIRQISDSGALEGRDLSAIWAESRDYWASLQTKGLSLNDLVRLQQWSVERERALSWLARAGWDESQHPRDESGKFTSGGGAGGAAPRPFQAPTSEAPSDAEQAAQSKAKHAAKIMGAVREIADQEGIDQSKIVEKAVAEKFTLLGKECTAAAIFDQKTGTIEIYPSEILTTSDAYGTVAHEISHLKWEDVRGKVAVEYLDMTGEPDFRVEPSPMFNNDGTLKPPYDEKYPATAEWREALYKFPAKDFADTDGVSKYSAAYWKEWEEGVALGLDEKGQLYSNAVNETLGEIARIREENEGDWLEAADFHDRPGLTPAQAQAGYERWRNLYETVERVYKMPGPQLRHVPQWIARAAWDESQHPRDEAGRFTSGGGGVGGTDPVATIVHPPSSAFAGRTVTSKPTTEQMAAWDKTINARYDAMSSPAYRELRDSNSKEWMRRVRQLNEMDSAIASYRDADDAQKESGAWGISVVHDGDEIQAVAFVMYNKDNNVANIVYAGALNGDAASLQGALEGADAQYEELGAQRIEGRPDQDDEEAINAYYDAGFHAAADERSSSGATKMVRGLEETNAEWKERAERKNAIARGVFKAADDIGYPKEKISFDEGTYKFELNGEQRIAAGSFNPTLADVGAPPVKIYVNHATAVAAPGVTAHEINHAKWHDALGKAQTEFLAAQRDPGPPPNPNGEEYWEKAGGQEAVWNGDMLRYPYNEKYPAYAKMQGAFFKFNKTKDSLAAWDGVSKYSADYWTSYRNNPDEQRYKTAVNETLAEIARVKYETGEYPLHRWLAPGISGDAVAIGEKRWRRLYETVSDVYELPQWKPAGAAKSWLTLAWDESQHPRDEQGRFSSGGGGVSGTSPTATIVHPPSSAAPSSGGLSHTSKPSSEQAAKWDGILQKRQVALERSKPNPANKEAFATYQRDERNLRAMRTGISAYYRNLEYGQDKIDSGAFSINVIHNDEGPLAVAVTHYNADTKVAKVVDVGAMNKLDKSLVLADAVERGQELGAEKTVGLVWIDDPDTISAYEHAGFRQEKGSGDLITSGDLVTMVHGENVTSAERRIKESKFGATVNAVGYASASLGFDRDKIEVESGTRTFMLNGVERVSAGTAHIYDDPMTITIWGDHIDALNVGEVVAHEVKHVQFQTVRNAYDKEQAAFLKDPGPPPNPDGEDIWERQGGWQAMRKPDGSLRPAYAEKYPLYDAMRDVWSGKNIDALADADGVTEYSYEYWKGFKEGTVSVDLALHETLAEMAAIKYKTGKFPTADDHYGYRLLAYRADPDNPGEFLPKPSKVTINRNAKKWRNLYELVDKFYVAPTTTAAPATAQAAAARSAPIYRRQASGEERSRIQRADVDGRPALILYINDDFKPVDEKDATMVRVNFIDEQGGSTFLILKTPETEPEEKSWREPRLPQQAAPLSWLMREFDESKHPRDEGGKFTSTGGNGAATAPRPQPAIKVSQGVSDITVNRAKAAFNAIPASDAAIIKDIPVKLVKDSFEIPRSAGNMNGLFRSMGKEPLGIYVAEQTSWPDGKLIPIKSVTRTTTHEVGHAIDHHSDHQLSKQLNDDLFNGFARMSNDQMQAAKYFGGDQGERFAELYALAYDPDKSSDARYFGGLTREDAENMFPEALDRLRSRPGVSASARRMEMPIVERTLRDGWFITSQHLVFAIINGSPYEVDPSGTILAELPPGDYTNEEIAQRTKAFDESKHPRDEGGKFTSGGGATGTGEKPAPPSERRPHVAKLKGATAEGMRKVKQGIRAIPVAHQELLKNVPVTLHRNVSTLPKDISGGDMLGCYVPQHNSINLAETKTLTAGSFKADVPLTDLSRITIHELGHAFDYNLPSDSGNLEHPSWRLGKEFQMGYDRMSDYEKANTEYYTSDPEETFAELYALAYNPPTDEWGSHRYFGNAMTQERAEEAFKEALAKVKAL